jgi:hypothetical protein
LSKYVRVQHRPKFETFHCRARAQFGSEGLEAALAECGQGCSVECGKIAEVQEAQMEILDDNEIPF